MNILSAQEMNLAQISLLKITLKPSYRLRLPAQSQYPKLITFQSTLFPPATHLEQQKAQAIVKLTDNLKGIKCNQPNGVFQSIFYSIMRILYQDKYRPNNQNEEESVHYLLETIKCSLYSPDIDFTIIKGVDFPVETTQMKAMAATFLNIMQSQELKLAINRLKCFEWICEHNPLLVSTFILFFRFILMRLQIQGAINYNQLGNIEESVVNLIEYFDLAYRNFGEMFMFHEEGIFLALVEESLVVGDYFQNESEKNNEKQQLQIKSSVKMNMIESFLMNVDEKSSLIAPKKKNCVVDSDIKLLNFMLDEEESQQVIFKEKDQLDTPHFNQGSQDIFHFGKKRKQSQIKNDEVKMELRKLISNQTDSFIESEHNSDNEAPTPFLGGEQNFNISVRLAQNGVPEIISEQMVAESPSDQLDSIKNGANFVSRLDVRQTAQNLIFYGHQVSSTSQFSPQSQGSPTFQQAQGFPQAAPFFQNVSPSIHQLQKCICRPFRINRSTLSSNTVNINFIPSKRYTSPNKIFPAAAFEHGRKGTNQMNSPTENKFKFLDHKPTFLKIFKKTGQNQNQKAFIHQTIDNNRTIDFPKRPRLDQKEKLLQKTSAILTNQKTFYHDKSSKSLNKNIDSLSNKSQGKIPYSQRFEGQQTTGPLVQKTSGFYQKSPEYSQLGKNNNNFLSTKNSPSSSINQQPYKFYAPVQIIAPTVYLNSSKNNNNNIVVKVSDYKERKVSINDYGYHPNPNPEARSRPQQRIDKNQAPLETVKQNSGTNSCSAIKNPRNV